MRRRSFLIAAAALAACSPAEQKTEAPPSAAGGDPAAVIRAVYAPYLEGDQDDLPDLLDRAPWSASLWQALVVEEASYRPGEDIDPDGLVFDPFINSQEWFLEDLNVVTEAVVPESHAVVRASFNRDMAVVYDLIWEDGSWRIDNMRSGGSPDGWNLRRIVTRERRAP